ncbi:galectin-5-like isoform X2 [Narcine bancroftii]|uniref:galectin-5-like isoform X2 n=1 Tax=Narcine bancroftii TaxID=1343680 RepID=UPI0038312175
MSLKPIVEWTELNVPFKKKFPQVLREDMMVMICGKIPASAKFFVVNLQDGLESQIIPFHFAGRFDEGTDKVVFSSQKEGNWAPMLDTCCNFGNRQNGFKINMFIWENCYQVCVNGNHVLTYDHTPDCKIDTVNIYGEMQIDSIKLYDLRCA